MPTATAALSRKFDSIAELTQTQQAGLTELTGASKHLSAGESVVTEGDRPSCVTLLVSGLLCRSKVLADGGRQIMAFHTPGDIPDMQSIHLKRMDHTLAAVTASTVVLIPHTTVFAVFEQHPDIEGLCWRDTLIDAAIFREWMVGMGRRSAYERMAHLFCEIIVKTRATGYGQGNTCDLPVTQTDLADALGLSTVHVNRTLQELRSAHLVDLRKGKLTVTDWAGLQDAGQFDAGYLHLRPERSSQSPSPSTDQQLGA